LNDSRVGSPECSCFSTDIDNGESRMDGVFLGVEFRESLLKGLEHVGYCFNNHFLNIQLTNMR